MDVKVREHQHTKTTCDMMVDIEMIRFNIYVKKKRRGNDVTIYICQELNNYIFPDKQWLLVFNFYFTEGVGM